MYQKAKNSWIKHIDFVILDILCLQVSFFLAYLVRHRNLNLYSNSVYGNLAIVLILIDVCMMFFLNTCKNVLKRGLLIELAATMRQVSLVILFAVFYLFFVKNAGDFSRITLFLTAIFYAIISYGTRTLWKWHVLRNLRLGRKNSIVILTDWANLQQKEGECCKLRKAYCKEFPFMYNGIIKKTNRCTKQRMNMQKGREQ